MLGPGASPCPRPHSTSAHWGLAGPSSLQTHACLPALHLLLLHLELCIPHPPSSLLAFTFLPRCLLSRRASPDCPLSNSTPCTLCGKDRILGGRGVIIYCRPGPGDVSALGGWDSPLHSASPAWAHSCCPGFVGRTGVSALCHPAKASGRPGRAEGALGTACSSHSSQAEAFSSPWSLSI